jgi:hypothetical protein
MKPPSARLFVSLSPPLPRPSFPGEKFLCARLNNRKTSGLLGPVTALGGAR